MTNTVLIKRSSTANAVPDAGNLQPGELAINYNDGNLFYKNTSNVVTVIASNQFVSVSGNITGANINTGNISAAGNITVVGITSTGNVDLTGSGNVSLGNAANVHITGGSAGYVLSTDGSGNLSWIGQSTGGSTITVDDFTGNGVQTQFTLSVTPPNIDSTTVNYNGIIQLRTSYSLSGANIVFPTAPANGSSIEVTTISVNLSGAAGSNTQVQFNNGGNFGASSAFTFDSTTNTLSATNFVGNGSQLTGVVATDIGVLSSLSVTGNTTTGNLLTGGVISALGNITAGNISVTNITGTLTTASQPNITSVGTLSSLNSGTISSSGNITAANILTDGLISAQGNVTGNYLLGNGAFITGLPAGYANSDVANYLASGTDTQAIITSGNVSGGNVLTGGLVSATGNVYASNFIGNVQAGIISASGNITGSAGLFNNGLSVVGNITATGNLNYQNVTDLVVGDPLIYIGANNTSDIVDLGIVASANVGGLYQHLGFVRDHTDAVWKLFGNVVNEPTTVIDWANAVYQSFLAGNVSSTGTVISTGNITGGNILTGGLISATTSITSAGNITGNNVFTTGLVSAQGNVTANYFIGNGSQLTGVVAASMDANNLTGTTLASSVVNSSLTSVGTLTSLNSGTISSSGNITGTNILTGGLISATGNLTANNISANDIAGTLTTASQTNITAVGTLVSLNSGTISSSGNVTANYFIGNGSQLTGLPEQYGNANVAAYLASGTDTQAIITSGNVSSGNLLTGGLISAQGNVTANYFIGNGSQLTGLPEQYGNANVAAYLASGTDTQNIVTSGNVSAGNLLTSGIVSAAGIVNSGNVDLISSGNISLGNVGNVHITGGTNGYILSTNGSGNLTWIQSPSSSITVDNFTGNGVQTEFTLSVTPNNIDDTTVNYNGIIQLRTGYTLSGANVVFPTAPANGSSIEVTTISTYIATSVAGSNTQVQFNDSGNIGASPAFTFDKTSNAVSAGALAGSRANVTVTSSTTIDTFATSTYRGAKYLIQGGNGTDYQASDVLLIHNGTDAYITVSTVCSNNVSDVFSVSAIVDLGNVVLSATKIATGTVKINLTPVYVTD